MSASSSYLSRSSIEDVSSAYAILSSDNPSTVLVSPVLDGDNYYAWRRSMQMTLGVRSKMHFVHGTLPEPEDSDPNYEQWHMTGSDLDCKFLQQGYCTVYHVHG